MAQWVSAAQASAGGFAQISAAPPTTRALSAASSRQTTVGVGRCWRWARRGTSSRGLLLVVQARKRQSSQHSLTRNEEPDMQRRAMVLGAGAILTCSWSCGCGCACAGSVSDALSKRNPLLDRFFASSMSTGMQKYEELLSPVKRQLFGEVLSAAEDGSVTQVLEVGVGTAPNLKYYGAQPNIRVLGLDPNLSMEPYARENAQQAGLGPDDFSIVAGVLEEMPIEDSSVDLVVGTLVLCSVVDAQRAVEEVLRVLRPGGKYLFIEHVAASPGTMTGRLQNLFTPLQTFLADGCHLNRQTGTTIESAGFSEVDIRRFTVEELSILGPHVAGIATK